MMVDKTTGKQLGGATGKGFMPGQSGNPEGRPKGSVSIITRVKQILKENPEKLEEIAQDLLKDKKLRIELIRQVDGMPKQAIEHEGEIKVKPILGGLSGLHSHDSDQETGEAE